MAHRPKPRQRKPTRAEMTQRSSPDGASSISCCVSVGSLISGPAAAAACTGAVVMNQSAQPEIAVLAGTATAHQITLDRLV